MEQLLYSYQTEKERLELAYKMREQFIKKCPHLADWANVPMSFQTWAIENPDKSRMQYQLWLYDILEVTSTHDLDTHIGPLAQWTTSDSKCHAWIGRCKNPNEFKHWTRSPSNNPGSGTRHKTLNEAVQWAKSWIDMREKLIDQDVALLWG